MLDGLSWGMEILVLLGSAHTDGTSATLAKSFIRGAEEAGNHVTTINCAKKNVHPCIGCNNCLQHGVCVWTDDMPAIEQAVKDCDAIVFVSPVYFFGITAQMKTVIDRFYPFAKDIIAKKPRMGIITAAAEKVYSSTGAVMRWYDEMIKYTGCENLGAINAVNVPEPAALDDTDYLDQAYLFGKSIS